MKIYYVVCLLIIFSRFQNKKSRKKHSIKKDSQFLKDDQTKQKQGSSKDFQSIDQIQQDNLSFIEQPEDKSIKDLQDNKQKENQLQQQTNNKSNKSQENSKTVQNNVQTSNNDEVQDLQQQPVQKQSKSKKTLKDSKKQKKNKNDKVIKQKTKKDSKKSKQKKNKQKKQTKDNIIQNNKKDMIIVPIPQPQTKKQTTEQSQTNNQPVIKNKKKTKSQTQNESKQKEENKTKQKSQEKKDEIIQTPSEFQSIDDLEELEVVENKKKDKSVHVQSFEKKKNQKPQEEESYEIDAKSKELGDFLQNLFMTLGDKNPFQMMTDEVKQLEQDQSQQDIQKLQSSILDIQNSMKNHVEIQLDQTQKLGMQPVILQIPKDVTDSSGGFLLEIYDKENDKVIKDIGTLEIFEFIRDKTVPISTKLLKDYTQQYLRIRLVTLLMGQGVDIRISKMNFFDLKFSQTIKIVSKYVQNIYIQTTYTSEQIQKLSDQTRLQFILKTSLITDEIKGNEYLSMKINQSDDFPTKKDFQMQASGSVSGGLIKTLNSKNENFCINLKCVYSITIRTKHIEEITFFASNLNNGQELEIQDSLHMIEELQPGELVKYIFKLNNNNKDYLFTIYPTENKTKMYVQPGREPVKSSNKQFKGYNYSSQGKGTTKMLITQKELQYMNLKDDKFYIAFEGADKQKDSTFIFEFTQIEKGKIFKINENEENSGVITKNEIAQYYLDLFTGEPDSFDIQINLKTYEEGALMYLKECYDQEQNCQFTPNDFNDKKQKNQLIQIEGINKGIYEQNINLKVNCISNDPFEERNNYSNGFPISVSCKFVIGIINDTTNILNYQLTTKGNTVHQLLRLGISTTLTLNPVEEGNYKFQLTNYGGYKTLVFKFVSLVGDCQIYLSTKDKFPDQDNNEVSLRIENENLTSVSTKTFHKILNSNDFSKVKYIYMSIFTDTYTVIDVYSDYVAQKVHNVNELAETVQDGQLIYRNISEDSFYKTDTSEVFYKDFRFYANSKNKQDFDIQLNSEIMGLHICLQNSYSFDPNKKCEYQSSTENLKVKNNLNKKKQTYYIRISKEVQKDEIFERFPIEFNLLIHKQGKHSRVQTLQSGQTMSKKLDPNQHVVLKIEFDSNQKNTTILFTSHNFYLQAKVTTDVNKKTEPLALLNSHNFAMLIPDQKLFASKYCKHVCKLFIIVENVGIESSRFQLSFIKNNQALLLKEGEQIFVPANRNFYFITKPKNNKPLELTFKNQFSQSVLFGKITNQEILKNQKNKFKKLKHHISENNFDYKTDIDKNGEIIINQKEFIDITDPLVIYLLVPKFNFVKERQESTFTILEEQHKTSVTLHASLQKLSFNHEVSGQLQQGDFKYFSFTIDEPQNVTIIMTSNAGKSTLYVNKGIKNLPNEKTFWKKGQNFQTQEITILKNEFENHEDRMIDTYTIGIFANTVSYYNIIIMSNFDNLIKVSNQQIRSFPLEKLKMYFFDFYSNKMQNDIMLYTDLSDVEISFLRYDEEFGENLLSQLHGEQNIDKKFLLKANSIPYKETNKSPLNLNSHFIVRARALNNNTNLDLAIYDFEAPLMVKAEERITMLLDKGVVQIYEANIGYDMQEADIDIKLEFGKIETKVSFDKNFKESFILEDAMQQSILLTDQKDKKKSNDIAIFKKIFLQVKAEKKSKFSFLMKPHNQFRQIKLMEAEIIKPRKDQDIYIYLEITHKQKMNLKNLRIDIQNIKHYDYKIQLLFNSDQNIQLNSNDPFIPMPIKKQFKEKSKFANHQTIYPEILQGYYVLKIPANQQDAPVKITISSNNQKKLEVNGEYYEKAPDYNQNHEYFIYLPEPGEFRIILESCSSLKLDSAIFIPDDTGIEKLIEFPDNLLQEYPYVFDEDDDKVFDQTIKKLAVPVHRGIIDKPGLLKFNIYNKSQNLYNLSTAPLHFNLITEFKPKTKQLIFKDYVDYYPKNKEVFNYEFTNNFQKLKVTAQVPMFKRQLTQDYPNVKRIMIEMHFYLLGDNQSFVQYFDKCGLSIVNRYQPEPKLHIILKKIDVENIRRTDQVTVSFLKKEIYQMKNFEKLMVFSHMRISFLENDEDTYDITLNRKFTDVPYFLLKIDNLNQTLTDWSLNKMSYYSTQVKNHSRRHSKYYIIGAAIFVMFVIYCCLRRKKQREQMINEIQEIKGQYVKKEEFDKGESNKIEMANVQQIIIIQLISLLSINKTFYSLK